MVIACLIVALICVGLFIFATVNNKRLEKRAAAADAEAERLRQYYESETIRIQNETQSALANAQALLDQQLEETKTGVRAGAGSTTSRKPTNPRSQRKRLSPRP